MQKTFHACGAAAAALVFTATFSGCTAEKPAIPVMSGPAVTVLAAGDIADCRHQAPAESGAARTAGLVSAELAKDPSALVLTLGDNTYPIGLPAEFTSCYDPTWGRFKARTFPSPGNHDYATKGAPGYYEYFGAAAGPERRGYYSFNIGKWQILSLNSNLRPPEMATQFAWLKSELEHNKAPCTLAYWHHPVFSSGGHGDNPRMAEAWKILMAAKAELVLTGHDHDYERLAPLDAAGNRDDANGLHSFVVGTGGSHLTPFRLRRDHSQASDNFTHGILKLVLKDAGYEWEFLPVVPGGFTDKGSARCH